MPLVRIDLILGKPAAFRKRIGEIVYAGRTVELKKAFFKRIADDLHDQLKVRREDVVINLVEVAKENWSFGGGVAQYAS
jgi:phenylpyruvate tautomerase PptA (4-oxalocrotonate tautomerase family)